jgi:predicted Rossmann fold nucleotide-binding protein DprA/Smf involved in DNA uptake
MPDVSAIERQVHARLKELERLIQPLREEYEKLKKMASALESNVRSSIPTTRTRGASPTRSAAAAKTTAANTSATTRRAPRRRRAGRTQQALDMVTKQPGITVAQMAQQMGISPNYLYRVLPQLQKDGKIRKQGKGYVPAES